MAETQIRLIKPPVLRPKDRVGLVAPSARPYKPSAVAQSVRLVEELGLVPVVGRNVLAIKGHLAGSDEERLADFNAFLEDESIKGIFCITGGFGALPLLSGLNYKAVTSQPKIIVGSDDNTSICLAVYSQCGLVSFHGPNLDEIKTRRGFDYFKSAVMNAAILPPIVPDKGELQITHPYVSVSGTGTGRLLGGNLTALSSLFGTPYQPPLLDSVLFLTDRDERHDVIERWLTTLNVSGELAKVSAVVFGYFDNCGSKGSFNLLSLEDMLGDMMKELNLPSCFDLPIAGGADCPTVPIGVRIKVDTEQCRLEFLESATQ